MSPLNLRRVYLCHLCMPSIADIFLKEQKGLLKVSLMLVRHFSSGHTPPSYQRPPIKSVQWAPKKGTDTALTPQKNNNKEAWSCFPTNQSTITFLSFFAFGFMAWFQIPPIFVHGFPGKFFPLPQPWSWKASYQEAKKPSQKAKNKKVFYPLVNDHLAIAGISPCFS